MSEELIFLVKGSAPEPYVVDVSLSPLLASCTCQAAGVGLPCKHRIMILQGAAPGIIEGDKSKLAVINKAAEASGFFGLLESYEAAKKEKRAIDGKAEKAFKKYRDAQLALLQKKVKTDRAVIKARNEMEAAIEAIVPVAEKAWTALYALRKIMPLSEYGPSGEEMVEEALLEG